MHSIQALRVLLTLCCVIPIMIACEGPAPSPFNSPTQFASTLPTSVPSITVPTPEPGTAILHGRFQALTDAGRVLMAGAVYAAPVEVSQGPTPLPLLRVDFGNDPQSTIHPETGEFIITGIQPGRYGILVHTPVSDFVINDDSGETLFLTLEAGQVLNVGTLILP